MTLLEENCKKIIIIYQPFVIYRILLSAENMKCNKKKTKKKKVIWINTKVSLKLTKIIWINIQSLQDKKLHSAFQQGGNLRK